MKNNKKLTVLITGCSSGFGHLSALGFARSGHKVFASMRTPAKGAALLETAEKEGLDIRITQLDVCDQKSIDKAAKEIEVTAGNLDILVNNAGIGFGGFFYDQSIEELQKVMETNLTGVARVTKSMLPMIMKSKGRIINISSVAGRTATPGMNAYNASKWAVEGLTESLNLELHPFGVKAVLVEPGPYPTKVIKENLAFAEKSDDSNSPFFESTERMKRLYKQLTAGLRSNPEDVSRIIYKAATVKKPRLRYLIGPPSAKIRVFFRSVLPFGLYRKAVTRVVFGKSKPKG